MSFPGLSRHMWYVISLPVVSFQLPECVFTSSKVILVSLHPIPHCVLQPLFSICWQIVAGVLNISTCLNVLSVIR